MPHHQNYLNNVPDIQQLSVSCRAWSYDEAGPQRFRNLSSTRCLFSPSHLKLLAISTRSSSPLRSSTSAALSCLSSTLSSHISITGIHIRARNPTVRAKNDERYEVLQPPPRVKSSSTYAILPPNLRVTNLSPLSVNMDPPQYLSSRPSRATTLPNDSEPSSASISSQPRQLLGPGLTGTSNSIQNIPLKRKRRVPAIAPNDFLGQMSLAPATQTTVVTTTTTTTTEFPPLVIKAPRNVHDLDPLDYPLARLRTPASLRHVQFSIGDQTAVLKEADDTIKTANEVRQNLSPAVWTYADDFSLPISSGNSNRLPCGSRRASYVPAPNQRMRSKAGLIEQGPSQNRISSGHSHRSPFQKPLALPANQGPGSDDIVLQSHLV